MKRIYGYLLVGVVALAVHGTARAQDSTFEIPPPDTSSPSLELNGSVSANYTALFNRTDSPLYQLSSFGKDTAPVTATYPVDLYLNGDYQNPNAGAHLKTLSEYANDGSVSFSLIEAYGSFSFLDASVVSVGKRIYSWGKGYAFNAVAYVNAIKNPEDVDALSPGLLALDLAYTKSIQAGPLDNGALELLLIPPTLPSGITATDITDTAYALRLYLLLWNTDIDLMGYYHPSSTQNFGVWNGGFDFSRNIVASLEIHGELSYFYDRTKYTITGGSPTSESINGLTYLAGLRWLNSWNMTVIGEYFHDDGGLATDEFSSYGTYLRNAADSNLQSAISSALKTKTTYFSAPRLQKDYGYLKISSPEPFGIVDLTPSVFTIYNFNDQSDAIGLSLQYTPFTNFTGTVSSTIPIGGSNTEYGIRPSVPLKITAQFFF
jgi:hypothetical protein